MSDLIQQLDDVANATRDEVWRPLSVTSESMVLHAILSKLDLMGYVIVPREPTEAMLEAGYHAENHHQVVADLYRQMIAAGEVSI